MVSDIRWQATNGLKHHLMLRTYTDIGELQFDLSGVVFGGKKTVCANLTREAAIELREVLNDFLGEPAPQPKTVTVVIRGDVDVRIESENS